jgi:hypothetical protein
MSGSFSSLLHRRICAGIVEVGRLTRRVSAFGSGGTIRASVKFSVSGVTEPELCCGGDGNCSKKEPHPLEEASKTVADGGEQGVDGVAGAMGELVAAHAVPSLEMSDHGSDGGAPPAPSGADIR